MTRSKKYANPPTKMARKSMPTSVGNFTGKRIGYNERFSSDSKTSVSRVGESGTRIFDTVAGTVLVFVVLISSKKIQNETVNKVKREIRSKSRSLSMVLIL